MRQLRFLIVLLFTGACRDAPMEPLFTLVPPETSGVTFVNELVEREGLNIIEYEYFANGGGVAVGDINNDGLPDLYFSANMGPDALYLNRGNFRFEDITARAGVDGGLGWDTGVTMADVNGDGLLDIYLCKSGNVREELRRNKLYINQGDLTFIEQAAAYGIDDAAHSTHAAFFDYDRDGDLDLFLTNHSIRRLSHFDTELVRKMRDPLAGDKLYRNDSGHFVDVSEEAGIIANPIGFGLSASVSDINKDGWPDLYVANDYIEDDYLYINNGDGTFSERIREYLTATSYSSMGTDIADFNNDALPDIITLDMLPESHRRQKILDGPADYEEYRQMRDQGYHHQFMRNMLHLNNGVGPFSEIGQLAGIASTDWSWAPLLADYDNDGLKDLFVTTGYLRDYTNTDFWEQTVPQLTAAKRKEGRKPGVMELLAAMPASEFRSYLFRNRGDLTFEPVTELWGISRPSLSNGAAYADLDADGDLDLIVNNINQPAFLYRNEADRLTSNHYLRIHLAGRDENTLGIGARVTLTTEHGRTLYQELHPSRGFQSSVEPVLLFGLGSAEHADVEVIWPDGTLQTVSRVAADQTLILQQHEAGPPGSEISTHPSRTPFEPVSDNLGLDFVHREDPYIDFGTQPLLLRMLSRFGPALAVGDVNRDGLEDVYVGGAHSQAGALYLQQLDGRFSRGDVPDFDRHAVYEDEEALFVDIDNDGDLDLYVCSGGGREDVDAAIFQDRIYINSGFGRFAYDSDLLPEMAGGCGAIAAADYDKDGDQDLFVGGRVQPGRYPFPARSYVLENIGGRFIDATERASTALLKPGLITDAAWVDLDGNGLLDLVLVGEWMPIRVFRQHEDHTFEEITSVAGFEKTDGWWNRLLFADLDNDGDLDLVAGNRGINTWLRPATNRPVMLAAGDFDGNGSIDAIPSVHSEGAAYPAVFRDELTAVLPSLKRRFPTYTSYADATLADVISREHFRKAHMLTAFDFETSIFENDGKGTFTKRPLPIEAQFAPINDILVHDVDRDGYLDVVLAGNDFGTRVQSGRADAGRGLLLLGRPGLLFEATPPNRSGFLTAGDVRHLALLSSPQGLRVLVANNDGPFNTFTLQ